MLKIRSFSICIFLCAILSTNSCYASEYFSNAFRIYSEGKFYEASIEFERAAFYESDIVKIAQCKYFKSLCYREIGKNFKALEELNEINLFNLPDTLFFLIRYQLAFCNYLNDDPNRSIWNIEEIRFRIPDTLESIQVMPLNILCLNSLRKWEEAKVLFKYLLDNTGLNDQIKEELQHDINSLYKKRSVPKFYSPTKAGNLSRFFPGLGQAYCGNFGEGSFNFLMNAAILSFSMYEFYSHYYITGYIVGLTMLNKTYSGGIKRSSQLAEKENQENLRKFNLEASSILIRIMQSGNLKNKYNSNQIL